jgi:hypothetical protein
MRLPPPFGQQRLHPEDAPLPNMREYAQSQSRLIVEAATQKPQPDAIITVGAAAALWSCRLLLTASDQQQPSARTSVQGPCSCP